MYQQPHVQASKQPESRLLQEIPIAGEQLYINHRQDGIASDLYPHQLEMGTNSAGCDEALSLTFETGGLDNHPVGHRSEEDVGGLSQDQVVWTQTPLGNRWAPEQG